MANDSFAFDAYDRLVGRTSMVGSPVSLVVRNPEVSRVGEVLERCLTLLAERRSPDEIILALASEPTYRPPSRIGVRTIRTVVHPRAGERQGLEWLIANARWPIAAFVGPSAELPRPALQGMLEALEHADVVLGRRRGIRGRFHPLSWMARRLFGVGVTDPLSPFVAMRRESFAGVPLEIDEPLSVFELLAKSTFAFAIYDEIEVDVDASTAPPIARTLREHWKSLVSLYRRPRFWEYSPGADVVRAAPQQTRPPRMHSLPSSVRARVASRHPLRTPSIFESGLKPFVR